VGSHDKYGKDVLRAAAGKAFLDRGASVKVDFGTGHPARIDGTVSGTIAVEVESRTSKQVRGAVPGPPASFVPQKASRPRPHAHVGLCRLCGAVPLCPWSVRGQRVLPRPHLAWNRPLPESSERSSIRARSA